SHTSQDWIFLCFALAFVVKMPLVPFHGWLAEGYKSMPIPAVAVFSAILSKVAAYGFLRIVLPLFPYASVHYQTLMLIVALVSILWATAVAFTTPDARLVIAYSSVAQLSFITLGIFSLKSQGGQGALLQMLNHALVRADRGPAPPGLPRQPTVPSYAHPRFADADGSGRGDWSRPAPG
ncbi:MAG TPA: proton-conducting transporter membrane subunit, partial [Terriglobales bacterium]|nr:proton-conducting transporter membrane subunit [Terriglobales bacterium]